jgi:hypothetical protein
VCRLEDSISRWVMQIEPQQVNQINSIDDSNNNNKLWHQRYGHLSMKTLQKIKQHLVGMSLTTNRLQKCHNCIVSKIVCRSFPKSISLWQIVEMQDAQGYVARCTTLSTSSFCLVVWSARRYQHYSLGGDGFKPCS